MQLCNARTRSGNACRRFGNVKNGRCHLHGGKSTGPRTDEGRRRIAKAHFKHGRRSKSYVQQRHDFEGYGGEGGIRTHDGLAPMPVFKTGAFNRSATSPLRLC